jgi:glycosyltransferase involved in cell wall biosynthesis
MPINQTNLINNFQPVEDCLMKNLRTEQEIIDPWQGDPTQPIVSVCCLTYNHEPYIEDALEGFLSQETDFPFEILIHDDASNDHTAEIIRRYVAKYPKLIKPIYQTNNQYSQGNNPTRKFNFPRAKGKYIAFCEGDDYWSDSHKLQIQIDFLEAHPDYVLSFHDVRSIDLKGRAISDSIISDPNKRDYSAEELMKKFGVQTLSLCFRNLSELLLQPTPRVLNGDAFLTSQLGEFGKGKYHPEIKPGVYRHHPGGVWSSLGQIEKLKNSSTTSFALYDYHKGRENYDVSAVWYKKYIEMRALIFVKALKKADIKSCMWVLQACYKERNLKMLKDMFLGSGALVGSVYAKVKQINKKEWSALRKSQS